MQPTMDISTLLLKALMLLLLSEPAPEPTRAGGIALRDSLPYSAPIYLEADVAAAREFILTSPDLRGLLSEVATRKPGRDGAERLVNPKIASRQVALELASFLRIPPGELQKVAAQVRTVGFWFLSFDAQEYRWRYLLVFDRGPTAEDILPTLLKRFVNGQSFIESTVAGKPAFAIDLGGQWLWLAERDGKTVMASDPFALQVFLAQSRKVELPNPPVADQEAETKPILRMKVTGEPFFGNLFRLIDKDDTRAFLAISALLDFPSWHSLTASYDGIRLKAALNFQPGSRLNRVLANAESPPPYLKTIPTTTDLAAVVSLRDPREIWQLVEDSSRELSRMTGEDNFAEALRGELAQNMAGLDIETDILANLASVAYVVPDLRSERDFGNRSLLLIETRDAAQAAVTTQKFINFMLKGRNKLTAPMLWDGMKIWEIAPLKIALMDKMLVLGLGAETPFEQTLKNLRVKSETKKEKDLPPSLGSTLSKRHPSARSFFSFDPTALFGAALHPASGGLWFERNSLLLEANVDGADIATYALRDMIWRTHQSPSAAPPETPTEQEEKPPFPLKKGEKNELDDQTRQLQERVEKRQNEISPAEAIRERLRQRALR